MIENMTAQFSDESRGATFKLIADQMRTAAERHEAVLLDIEILTRNLATEVALNRDIGDLEKRYISERLKSLDANIVRKARAEVSMMIRQLTKHPIFCLANSTVKIQSFPIDDCFNIDLRYDHSFQAILFVEKRVGDVWKEWEVSPFAEFRELVRSEGHADRQKLNDWIGYLREANLDNFVVGHPDEGGGIQFADV